MPNRLLITLSLLSCLLIGPFAALPAGANDPDARIQQAQALFQKYTALSDDFDPSVADLYADDAQIVAHRRYPTGVTRHMQMAGQRYKAMIRQVMPLARLRNDRNTFSDIDYSIEGTAVRIKSTRRSVLKEYDSPHSMLVRPDAAGNWRIYEETLHTRP